MHFSRLLAMMPRKRSVLREEAPGAIKTLKRLERTNPSVRMNRMDDYPAIYHKTSDAPADHILCLWAKPRWRSILMKEEFRAIKTLKRLDHTNPSVGIDEMYDYQVTYNKRWQIQLFLDALHFALLSYFFLGIILRFNFWPGPRAEI